MNLRTLSLDEFLRFANSQIDDLTSSDVERELLRRLEAIDTEAFEVVNEMEATAEDMRDLRDAMEGLTFSEVVNLIVAAATKDFTAANVTAFLNALDQAGITEPDELNAELELANKFKTLANDAGDIFTRLHTLTEETQED